MKKKPSTREQGRTNAMEGTEMEHMVSKAEPNPSIKTAPDQINYWMESATPLKEDEKTSRQNQARKQKNLLCSKRIQRSPLLPIKMQRSPLHPKKIQRNPLHPV